MERSDLLNPGLRSSRGLRAARMRPLHKPVQVQQMARLIGAPGPFACSLQLDADEVADLAVHAIAHAAAELAIAATPPDLRSDRNGTFHLQAGTRWGNVLQQADSVALCSRSQRP